MYDVPLKIEMHPALHRLGWNVMICSSTMEKPQNYIFYIMNAPKNLKMPLQMNN